MIDGTLHCSGGVVLNNNAVITGNGNGVVDLEGTTHLYTQTNLDMTKITLTGSAVNSPIYAYSNNSGHVSLTDCVVSGCSAPDRGTLRTGLHASMTLSNCLIESNSAPYGAKCALVLGGTKLTISGSTIGDDQDIQLGPGAVCFNGTNIMRSVLSPHFSDSQGSGTVTISSGAILDLTGNTNTTPINPGGGVTFAPGGATVIASNGTPYMMGGVTVPKLGNTNVVNLNSSHCVLLSGTTTIVSNCTITGGVAQSVAGAYRGGAFHTISGSVLSATNCIISGNTTTSRVGDAIYQAGGWLYASNCAISGIGTINSYLGIQHFTGCTIEGYTALQNNAATTYLHGGNTIIGNTIIGTSIVIEGVNTLQNCSGTGSATISSGASINLASSIIMSGGITVQTGGCTVNGAVIPSGTSAIAS